MMKSQEEIIEKATNDLVRYFEIMHPLSAIDKQYIRVIIHQAYVEGQFSMIEKQMT